MARVYSAFTVAGNRATSNSDDVYIQLAVPAGVNARIKRVNYVDGDGTSTGLIAESSIRIKLLQTSTTASGTPTAFTPVSRDATGPAAACTVLVRDTSTEDNSPGTITTTFDHISIRNIMNWEYIPRDQLDCITLIGSSTTFFCVVCSKNGTGVRQKTVSLVWEEF